MGDLKSAAVPDVTAVTKHTYCYKKIPTVGRKPNRKHSQVLLSHLRSIFRYMCWLFSSPASLSPSFTTFQGEYFTFTPQH